MQHRTWVELSRSALTHNIDDIRSALVPEADLCAVVKGNAYGHGITDVARICSDAGVRIFAVDSIEEALLVRKLAPESRIFCMGTILPHQLKDAVEASIIVTIFSTGQFDEVIQAAAEAQRKALINVKFDTGLSRLGIPLSEVKQTLISLKQHVRYLQIESLSSHLSSSEKESFEVSKKQHEQFEDILSMAIESGVPPVYVHLANGAATVLYKPLQYNLVRVGSLLYGVWPSEHVRREARTSIGMDIKPVLSLKTRIAQVRDILTGTAVGYGGSFVSDRPMRIAVLPIGYYDGIAASIAKEGHVLIHGRSCRILGRICMNMMIVDVSVLPQAKRGDVATLIGKDGMHRITTADHATWANINERNVTTSINSSIPRIVV